MLARVLSAALSRHSLPWETTADLSAIAPGSATAEVNGIEAFMLLGALLMTAGRIRKEASKEVPRAVQPSEAEPEKL